MRITTKFIGSSALLIVLSASLFGSGYAVNRRARQALGTTYDQSETAVSAVAKLEVALGFQVSALERLTVLENDVTEVKRYERSRQQSLQAVGTLQAGLFANQQVQQLQLESIRRQHDYLEKIAAQLISSDISQEQASEIIRALRIFEQSTQGHIRSISKSANEQALDYQKQQAAFHDQITQLGMLSFGLVTFMLAAQFYYLLKPVTQALQQLQSGAERIELDPIETGEPAAESNGLAKIQITTGDELQALAKSFNQMSDRLRASYQNLESRVAERTASLHKANQSLMTEVSDRLEAEASLQQALAKLKQTQLQLLQTDKMSSLGQLVAGVAHEINNPVSFIRGNLEPAQDYMNSLLDLIKSYQAECPNASEELQQVVEQVDLAFIQSDFPQLLQSMEDGAERIAEIVRSLQTFSHLDESDTKSVDLHEGLESSIFLMATQLKATPQRPVIAIERHYSELPKVYCYPGQINQVFMGILSNAIDALSPTVDSPSTDIKTQEAPLTIAITTDTITKGKTDFARIRISDNGPGMSADVCSHVFDPFFTTKPVGSGIGLGLSMSYQIVAVNHKGRLKCKSALGEGTTFTLEIPMSLKKRNQPVEPELKVTAMPGLLAS